MPTHSVPTVFSNRNSYKQTNKPKKKFEQTTHYGQLSEWRWQGELKCAGSIIVKWMSYTKIRHTVSGWTRRCWIGILLNMTMVFIASPNKQRMLQAHAILFSLPQHFWPFILIFSNNFVLCILYSFIRSDWMVYRKKMSIACTRPICTNKQSNEKYEFMVLFFYCCWIYIAPLHLQPTITHL